MSRPQSFPLRLHEGISLQKEGMGMERLSIDMKRNLPLDNPSPTAKVQEEITWQL